MFNFLRKLFSSRKKSTEGNTEPKQVQESSAYDNSGEGDYKPANLKELALLKETASFRNSFISETDLIQHFFKEFNNWMNNHINLQFSRYYTTDYQELLESDIQKLEEKDLEVFRYQQIIEKSVKDIEIKRASFELFAGAISMSDYTKKTMKVLKIEMDAIRGLPESSDEAIKEIRNRINHLMVRYNTDYDKYFRSLTLVRLRFMKAIEGFVNRIKSINEN